MAEYDGSISLSVETKTDTKSIDKSMSDLKSTTVNTVRSMNQDLVKLPPVFDKTAQAAKEASKAIGGIDMSNLSDDTKIAKMEVQLAKAKASAESLRAEIQRLSNQKVATEEYTYMSNELVKMKQREELLAQTVENASNRRTASYDKNVQKLATLRQEIADTETYIKRLVADGNAFEIKDNSAKIENLRLKLATAEVNAQSLEQKLADANNSGSFEQPTEGARNFGKEAQKAGTKASSAMSKTQKASHKLLGLFKNLGKQAKTTGNSMSKSFSGGLKNILKWGFGIRSFFVLFRKLRETVTEGLNAMGKQIPEFGHTLNSLKASFGTLKASLASAFQPLVSAVAPILISFMNLLTNVINKVAEFTAAITGQTYTYKAAAQSASDYADKVDDAKKAQDRLYKSGLDTFNNYTQEQSSASAGGGKTEDVVGQYSKQDVSAEVSDFVNKVKEAWQNADFTEIGAIIGNKLKTALENIPWGPIQAQAEKIGKSLGTLINGFVQVPGLGETVGKTVAEAINTGMIGLKSFLDTTNWFDVGTFLGNIVNGYVGNFKWSTMGQTIASGINAALATISSFLDTVNWQELGTGIMTSIGSALSNINWGNVGHTIISSIVAALDLITGLIKGIDFKALPGKIAGAIKDILTGANWASLFGSIGDLAGTILKAVIDWHIGIQQWVQGVGTTIRDYFLEEIKKAGWSSDQGLLEQGKNIIVGIFNGIVEFLKNVGTWIYDNIFMPFVNGFRSAFDIHSPTQDPTLVSFGTNIIEGIFNGIITWMGNIGGWLTANVFNVFSTAFETGKNAVNCILSIGAKFLETKDSLTSKWHNITSNLKDITVKAAVKIAQTWNDIKGKWHAIVDNIKDQNPKVKFAIQKWADLKSSLKTIINNMISWLNTNLIGKLNSLFKISVPTNDITRFLGINGLTKQIVSIPKIPMLAKGGVIPPNKEFLAMLGDQKHGTNIETPLDTMVDAFNKALANNGLSPEALQNMRGNNGGGSYEFVAQLDRRVLFDEIITEAKLRKSCNGINPMTAF